MKNPFLRLPAATLLSVFVFSVVQAVSRAPVSLPKSGSARPAGAGKPVHEAAIPKGRMTSKGGKPRDFANLQAVLHVFQANNSLGEITVKFLPDVAPNHVQNFVELTEKKFYDGAHFHFVDPRFKIQGGDPLSKLPDRSAHGTGYYEEKGKPRFLKAELSPRPFKRGAFSMARGTNLDSASSQFFICLSDETASKLDHQYTLFGEVVAGMDVADRIAATPRDGRDNPVSDVVIRSIELVEVAPAPPKPATAVRAPGPAPRR